MSRFADLDPFAARRAKAEAWRELQIDPYPPRGPEAVPIATARELGESLSGDATSPQQAVNGRIKALRGQGALLFADIHDATGKLQVLFKKDTLAEKYFDQLDLLDLGDFIWVKGTLFISKRGELTLEAHEWQILSKALRPLPDQWRGLQDLEQRQRQRYADLLVNEETLERFQKRSQFVAAIRRFLQDQKFMEVETPILEHVPGGADAEPFVTHHNALDTDFYLRISLELHLKRLVVGGFDHVFEIGKVFRNEGMSPQHLQEFTMLEFYTAYASAYAGLTHLVQNLYQTVIQEVFGTLQIERGEHVLNFAGDWPQVSYVEILKEYAGIDILTASDEDLVQCAVAHQVRTGGGEQAAAGADELRKLGRGRLLDILYKKTARPHLIQPQFVVDVPVEFSPLAKRKPENPRLTERIIVLIDGIEVGNGFSELNDPIDQRQRFEEQERLRLAGDPEAQRMDTDFLRALEYGMPPTAGFGVGIDRLFAVLTGLDSVRETVLFPTMRPEK